jgi:hypothetical protein
VLCGKTDTGLCFNQFLTRLNSGLHTFLRKLVILDVMQDMLYHDCANNVSALIVQKFIYAI